MKISAFRQRLMLGCVCAGLLFSQSSSAQEHAAVNQESDTPTLEEAKAFLDGAEAQRDDVERVILVKPPRPLRALLRHLGDRALHVA